MKENDLIPKIDDHALDFKELKRRILSRYQEALDSDVVDTDMIKINQTINQFPEYVTTSSCTGRITIISKSDLRSKYQTSFHFKTHNPGEFDTYSLSKLSSIVFEGELWLLVESPNIHIRCSTLDAADRLHQYALQSKLSKSKFQSISPAIVLEVLGTATMQIPLGLDGSVFVNHDHFKLIKSKAVELLQIEQQRLFSFQDHLNSLE